MEDVEKLVNDWLPLSDEPEKDEENNTNDQFNSQLINALVDFLENPKYHEEFLAPICSHLFQLYRRKDDKYRLFVFTFIPSLVGVHLVNCLRSLEIRRKYHCVDALLLAIYNMEICNEQSIGSNRSIRIPSILKPSIYHEAPITMVTNTLESNMVKVDSSSGFTLISLYSVNHEQDYISASNRITIMTSLLTLLHDHMSSLNKSAHSAICRLTLKILRPNPMSTDDERTKVDDDEDSKNNNNNFLTKRLRSPGKIPLSSEFLNRLLGCVYFCIFTEFIEDGLQALDEIHSRAKSELYSDVLLMVNAIKNTSTANLPSQLGREMNDVSLVLSPTSPLPHSANIRAAITNASFRTHKLPEDIPIVTSSSLSSSRRMQAINEDA